MGRPNDTGFAEERRPVLLVTKTRIEEGAAPLREKLIYNRHETFRSKPALGEDTFANGMAGRQKSGEALRWPAPLRQNQD